MECDVVGEAVVGTASIPESVGGLVNVVEARGGVRAVEKLVTKNPGSPC